MVIAIDGPAGAGKSTVAKAVASRLGLRYLDTGAMYRCAALLAERSGLSPADASSIAAMLAGATIDFSQDNPPRVYLDAEDVTQEIRAPHISELASQISTHPEVRRELVRRQQALVAQGNVTLEGRDTTTVIAPHADVKIFLTASLEVRARRRWEELRAKGQDLDFHDLRAQIQQRDERDAARTESPLTIAEDAHVLDTDNLGIEAVVDRIVSIARESMSS